MVKAIIDTHLKACINFHDVLCGFRAGRGTETAILELKLDQYLSSIDQDPILLVFLDLHKAFEKKWTGAAT